MPVGTPRTEVGVTLAVNVTTCPIWDRVVDAVKTVIVPVETGCAIVTVTAEELLPFKPPVGDGEKVAVIALAPRFDTVVIRMACPFTTLLEPKVVLVVVLTNVTVPPVIGKSVTFVRTVAVNVICCARGC